VVERVSHRMDSNASLKIVKRARALRKAMTEPEMVKIVDVLRGLARVMIGA
jgi:hypothetical protein